LKGGAYQQQQELRRLAAARAVKVMMGRIIAGAF
jgi:hypothetical protein